MADIAIVRINYKSDFILTLQSDAGWLTPFCIKFWTGAPSQAYFAGYDGTTYTHCAPVDGDPTKLSVQFDDHHLPIGDLKFQIGYHFTVADFPTSIEDEVINQEAVIIDNDGEQQQVMLDFNGETAPEIAFAMPAYANEAQRIDNEQARIAAEEQRVSNEQQRISNEEGRISAEESRQENEQQRIHNEETRIAEFASLKADAIEATGAANDAATLANEKAQLAADKAALAQAAATLANDKAQLAADKAALAQAAATLANDKAALAQQKADYAQAQGDYAKAQGDIALADHERAETDHERAEADHDTATDDHTTATSDHTQAKSDHARAEGDHETAASDHTQASSDHSTATSDHTQAGQDHDRAESDHTTAAADHTRAESDHTRAESDHAAVEAYVDSLGAFDISAYHATGSVLAKYADLTAALGTNGANVPDTLRKGGMSIKFIQSSDNKYVQWRLKKNEWSTNVSDWENLTAIIEEEIGSTEEYAPSTEFTAGYAINASGSTKGSLYEASSMSVSDKIYLQGAIKYKIYKSGQDPYFTFAQYAEDDTCLSAKGTEVQDFIEFESGTAYIRYSAMTARLSNLHLLLLKETKGAIYEAIDDLRQDTDDAIEELHNEIKDSSSNRQNPYMKSVPFKPLLAEMCADFAWCSMILPNSLTSKNVVLTVSGSSGSTEVTGSAISPDTLNLSDLGSNWIGGLLSADGVAFKVCNFRLKTGNTIEIYPALTEDITNGTLSTLMYDSGANYVGMHLTENGYKAFMQNLYNKNPKHCEVGRYVARFRSDVDTTCPFTWYGGQINGKQYRFTTLNPSNSWFNRPSSRAYCYQFSSGWTPHTTKSGAYWAVDLKGNSGYLEAFIFPIAQGILTLPQDQQIHVEVTIDGELVLSQILTDTICKRICVDYKNATTGRIEIYSNKWAAVSGEAYGFGLGRVTWWVNDLTFDVPIFPKGSVIAEEFDSWGVFHDGASGKELERLHNEATGVTVPFTNHSLGSQTSAWGMAWFYENVWKYNPSICIQDFGINDTNSIPRSLPETIEGPDGKTYNNRLTAEQYCENMIRISKLAEHNNIQPIFTRNCLHGQTVYKTFSNALIDALSSQVE